MEISLAISIHATSCGEPSDYGNACEDERMICSHGKDNVLLSGVLDGCGGAGAKRYRRADRWTGARISSHETGRTLAEWFQAKSAKELRKQSQEEVAKELHDVLSTHLYEIKAFLGTEKSLVEDNLSAELPTTLAVMTAEPWRKVDIRIRSYWAGNSRNYVFLPDGLRQISRDNLDGDHDGDEPRENGILSNAINASNRFTIYSREVTQKGTMMLLSATDGVFGNFDSPIRLEWILLDTLQHAACPLDWEESLKAEIDDWSSDDHTMELVVLNAETFSKLKAAYRRRWTEMKTQYVEKLDIAAENKNHELYLELWRQYKKDYLLC